MIHGLILVIFSGSYYSTGFDVMEEFTPAESLVLSLTVMYFFYDAFGMMLFGLEDHFIMFHHFLTAWAMFSLMFQGSGATVVFCGLYYGEISNPAMQLRYILRSLDQKNSKLYEIIDFTFMIQYMYARLVYTYIALNYFLIIPETPVGSKIAISFLII